jgi:hypothetical protein
MWSGALIRNPLDCSLGSKMVHGTERKCHLRCVELIIFLLHNLDMSISCNFVFYQYKSNATIVLTMCVISCAGLQLKAEKDANFELVLEATFL